MNAQQRLLEIVQAPLVEFDRAAAVVGLAAKAGGAGLLMSSDKQDRPSLAQVEDTVVTQLDRLAAPLSGDATVEDVITHVFGTLGFHGNTRNYYQPENSLIEHVLVRRTGVPLSLALVAIEIGRRVGVGLAPIGMPGHFLLREAGIEETGIEETGSNVRYFDPFAGGQEHDAAGCQQIFERLVSGGTFRSDMLVPISGVSVMARMLQNLRVVYLRQGDVSRLANVLAFRVELPASPPDERLEYSKILGALGRYDLAATQRDLLAVIEPNRATAHLAAAKRHRARRN